MYSDIPNIPYKTFYYTFLSLLSSFDSSLGVIPSIVSGIWGIFYFLPLTYTLDLFAAALHVHMCTKVQLDFDRQLLSFNVYVLRMRDLYTNPSERKQIESFEIFGLAKRIHKTNLLNTVGIRESGPQDLYGFVVRLCSKDS